MIDYGKHGYTFTTQSKLKLNNANLKKWIILKNYKIFLFV